MVYKRQTMGEKSLLWTKDDRMQVKEKNENIKFKYTVLVRHNGILFQMDREYKMVSLATTTCREGWAAILI